MMSPACGETSKGIKVRPLNEFSKHSSRYSKGSYVRPLIEKANEDEGWGIRDDFDMA